MAIYKDKNKLLEISSDEEIKDGLSEWYWLFDYDYFNDYYECGNRCNCVLCTGVDYIVVCREDAMGVERKLCIPAGKEWLRRTQIDSLLDNNGYTHMSDIEVKMNQIGLIIK